LVDAMSTSTNENAQRRDVLLENLKRAATPAPTTEMTSMTPTVTNSEVKTPEATIEVETEVKVEVKEKAEVKVEVEAEAADDDDTESTTNKSEIAVKCLLLLFFLYFFLFSLDLMGTSFKILGGCTAGSLFGSINNPIAGLMIGILATVLVQSSSTSTSIVVALVGADALSVRNGIPVIMGANIGTSVTSTLVALGHYGNEDELELAFAGATVHDMFNFLCVGVFLPLEIITHLIQATSKGLVSGIEVEDGDAWEGPIKLLVAPLVAEFIYANKNVIKGVAQGDSCDSYYALNETTGLRISDALITCGDYCGVFYSATSTQAEDQVAASVCLFISLLILVGCLLGMVSTLHSIVAQMSEKWIRAAV